MSSVLPSPPHPLLRSCIERTDISLAPSRYYVTENDQIRSIANPDKEFNFFISKNDRVNEMQREAMNSMSCTAGFYSYLSLMHTHSVCIRKIVLERLEASGLGIVHVPLGTPKDEPHIPILASSEISKKQRVIVVLGEGNQDLGIWAYRTVGQKSINQGSAMDFVKDLQNYKAARSSSSASASGNEGAPGVIIANLGQLVWYRGGRRAMTLITWRALQGDLLFTCPCIWTTSRIGCKGTKTARSTLITSSRKSYRNYSARTQVWTSLELAMAQRRQ